MLLPTLRPGDAAARALLDRTTLTAPHVEDAVRGILAAVRARGDAAVREHTERFDKRAPRADGGYELPRDEWRRRAAEVAPRVRAALDVAAARIRAFHERQREA